MKIAMLFYICRVKLEQQNLLMPFNIKTRGLEFVLLEGSVL